MQIKTITWSMGSDLSWVGECEFCNHVTDEITDGYSDSNYHNRVIPSMVCKVCNLSSTEQYKHMVNVEVH